MAITRGEIKADVLTILNKTTATKGYFTDEKMNLGLREAMAFIAVEAFDAGQGWQNKIKLLDVPTGALSIPLPPDIAYIDQVRMKIGDVYVPLYYDQMREMSQTAPSSGQQAYPASFRIVDNQIIFNPPLSAGGSQVLWVEGTSYPKRILSDTDQIEGQFDIAMRWFMVYRICTFCAQSVGKADPEWGRNEAQWYSKLLQMLNKRNNGSQYIRNVCD